MNMLPHRMNECIQNNYIKFSDQIATECSYSVLGRVFRSFSSNDRLSHALHLGIILTTKSSLKERIENETYK